MTDKKIVLTGLTNPWGRDVYNAEIIPGQSIRIWGVYNNMLPPVTYNLTFKVGDRAVYGSYNTTWVGTIVSIGKCVTIEHDKERTRLAPSVFAWRNFNFDEQRIEQENEKERQCI